MLYESGVQEKSIFIKNNEKICDENLSIQKSLGYSYTVFKLKGSKCISTKGGGGRGPNRLDLTVGRFFFLLFGKMSSGWETVEIN